MSRTAILVVEMTVETPEAMQEVAWRASGAVPRDVDGARVDNIHLAIDDSADRVLAVFKGE